MIPHFGFAFAKEYQVGVIFLDDVVISFSGLNSLEELWKDFCKENGFKENSVDYVERA